VIEVVKHKENIMSVRIEIKSQPGTFATIPDEVEEAAKEYSWCIKDGYVWARVRKSKPQKWIYLHQLVIYVMTGKWPEKGMDVDHINHDPLDNRMCNLRVVTRSGNMRNMNKYEGTASQLQGVFWDKKGQKWFAKAGVSIDGKVHNIYSSLTLDEVIAGKCADVIRLLIGNWHPSKLNNPELTFFDKWYHIGKDQQEQILHSMKKNNIPIDPLSPYRSWYKEAV
jgi:hypothetical protein